MAPPPSRALVFDIETRIDWDYVRDPGRLLDLEVSYEPPQGVKDPTKIAGHHTEWWFKERNRWTFSPLTAEIVAIAWADLWEGEVHCAASEDEYEVLLEFADALSDQETVLTGYNVRGFDVPFVTARASLMQIELPWWWPHEKDYRRIADVFDVTRKGGCDDWLQRCGLPGKTSTGAHVEYMTIEQVTEYCTNDVHVERLLAQRFAPNMSGLRQARLQASYEEVPKL